MIARSEWRTHELTDPDAARAPVAATSSIRRILVATRGTQATDGALRVARTLAERTGASCELLTVFEPRIPPPLVNGPTRGTHCETPDRAEAAHLVRRVRCQRRSVLAAGPRWPVRLEVGYPPHVIARVAEQSRADLVIVGLGRTEPEERRLGSETGLRLAMLGDGAVLAVSPNQRGLPHRALVVVDWSEPESSLADSALALLDEPATLWLAQLVPGHRALHSARVVDAAAAALQRLCQRLQQLRWAPRSLELRRAVITGGSVEQLLRFVHAEGIELIAAPVHGSTFEERAVMSNVVAPLFRSARCSLLAAPESAAQPPSGAERERARTENHWRSRQQPGAVSRR